MRDESRWWTACISLQDRFWPLYTYLSDNQVFFFTLYRHSLIRSRRGIPVPRWPAFPEKPKGESSIADFGAVHHRTNAIWRDRAAIRLYLTRDRSIRIVICSDNILSTFHQRALGKLVPNGARMRSCAFSVWCHMSRSTCMICSSYIFI